MTTPPKNKRSKIIVVVSCHGLAPETGIANTLIAYINATKITKKPKYITAFRGVVAKAIIPVFA